MSEEFAAELRNALADLSLSAAQVATLAEHWALLQSWQQRINLTSISDPSEAAWLHYRDCLEVIRCWPEAASLVDMGSGGGFPGIPLAVARPQSKVLLVEPRRKRASFLRACKARLGLGNLQVLCGRSTDPAPELFDVLTSRATFSRPEDLFACRHWLTSSGTIIAMRSGAGSEGEFLPSPEDSEITSQSAVRWHHYALRGHKRALAVVSGVGTPKIHDSRDNEQ